MRSKPRGQEKDKNNKIQTVHIDRLAPCLLPPPPSPVEDQAQEQDTLVKQTAEPERRSTRSRKPNPMSKNKYTINATGTIHCPKRIPQNPLKINKTV